MHHTENEQSWDDFEIEISDLPDPDKADSDDAIFPSSRSSRLSLGPRFTSRQRILQAIATTSIVVLALSFIIGSYAPIRNAVVLGVTGLLPTPTPTLTTDDSLFYIQKTLSWSKVSLDGHALPTLPIVNSDPPLRLARGIHWFVWHAGPFQPISCSVSVPPANTDTCAYNDIARAPSGLYVRVVTFSPSLTTLPDDQRTALIQVAQAALDTLRSSETVQPGERFFSRQPTTLIDTATQALRATLRFQLDTDARFNAPCMLRVIGKPCTRRIIQDCRLFCTEPAQLSPPGEKSWDVFASIRSTWQYATVNGQTVAMDQPDVLIEHLVSLHITWDGMHWHAAIVPDTAITNTILNGGLACVLARDKINLNASYQFAEGDLSKTVNWFFASGPNPAAGCLAVATLESNNKGASSPAAYCLYRFGLLLAVNNTAHFFWPLMLPVDAYEQGLARQIAALPTSHPPLLHGQALIF